MSQECIGRPPWRVRSPASRASDSCDCPAVRPPGVFLKAAQSARKLPASESLGALRSAAGSPRTSEALFRHPTYPPPLPSNGLCGLSVVVRCAAPQRRVPRRGEDRSRNPFIQITHKRRKQAQDPSPKKGGRPKPPCMPSRLISLSRRPARPPAVLDARAAWCLPFRMAFAIQWSGPMGPATTHRNSPIDALRYVIEMLGKGYADVVIVDLSENGKA